MQLSMSYCTISTTCSAVVTCYPPDLFFCSWSAYSAGLSVTALVMSSERNFFSVCKCWCPVFWAVRNFFQFLWPLDRFSVQSWLWCATKRLWVRFKTWCYAWLNMWSKWCSNTVTLWSSIQIVLFKNFGHILMLHVKISCIIWTRDVTLLMNK